MSDNRLSQPKELKSKPAVGEAKQQVTGPQKGSGTKSNNTYEGQGMEDS